MSTNSNSYSIYHMLCILPCLVRYSMHLPSWGCNAIAFVLPAALDTETLIATADNLPQVTDAIKPVLGDAYCYDSTVRHVFTRAWFASLMTVLQWTVYALWRSFTQCTFIEAHGDVVFFKNQSGHALRTYESQTESESEPCKCAAGSRGSESWANALVPSIHLESRRIIISFTAKALLIWYSCFHAKLLRFGKNLHRWKVKIEEQGPIRYAGHPDS